MNPAFTGCSKIRGQMLTELPRFPSDRGAYSVNCFEHIPVGWWAGSAAAYCPSDARYSVIFSRKISIQDRMGNGVVASV